MPEQEVDFKGAVDRLIGQIDNDTDRYYDYAYRIKYSFNDRFFENGLSSTEKKTVLYQSVGGLVLYGVQAFVEAEENLWNHSKYRNIELGLINSIDTICSSAQTSFRNLKVIIDTHIAKL